MNKTVLALLVSVLLAGCQKEAQSDNQQQPTAETTQTSNTPQPKLELQEQKVAELTQEQLSDLKQQLDTLTADKSCDNSSQCQVTAVGDRACGGPSSYLIFSTKHNNATTVTQLADKITAAEKAYNLKNQVMSICEHLTKPSAQCVENKCVKLASNHPTQ